jgi:hypothetical protein
VAYEPAAWQNFYVMTGGAAAALTGLLFVAMSLHAKAILVNRFYSGRAISTLASLTTQLGLAATVLVPGASVTLIGAVVEAAAIIFLGLTVRIVFARSLEQGRVPLSAARRAAEWSTGLIWIVLFLASGLSLLTRTGGGFYVLALVMILMFAWNIYIAWVLITEVSE